MMIKHVVFVLIDLLSFDYSQQDMLSREEECEKRMESKTREKERRQ
jgi:hypothetical protein